MARRPILGLYDNANSAAEAGGGVARQRAVDQVQARCHGANGGTLAEAVLHDCTFVGNATSFNGGGVYNLSDTLTLSACRFYGNTVPQTGGGIFSFSAATVLLVNCEFSGNAATGREVASETAAGQRDAQRREPGSRGLHVREQHREPGRRAL